MERSTGRGTPPPLLAEQLAPTTQHQLPPMWRRSLATASPISDKLPSWGWLICRAQCNWKFRDPYSQSRRKVSFFFFFNGLLVNLLWIFIVVVCYLIHASFGTGTEVKWGQTSNGTWEGWKNGNGSGGCLLEAAVGQLGMLGGGSG